MKNGPIFRVILPVFALYHRGVALTSAFNNRKKTQFETLTFNQIQITGVVKYAHFLFEFVVFFLTLDTINNACLVYSNLSTIQS